MGSDKGYGMSNTLKIYSTLENNTGEDEMSVTAFVGGNVNGKCIQFTIGGKYCCLNEIALRDLMDTILKRIMVERGYGATDGDRDEYYQQEPTTKQ